MVKITLALFLGLGLTTATMTSISPPKSAGERLYQEYCSSCHQPDGSGVPGMYPPVKESDWVNGDKQQLIKVMLFGLEEEIVVNGKPYFNTMPNYRFMKDQEIADVLTYLRTHMGNAGAPISPDEVKALRKKK